MKRLNLLLIVLFCIFSTNQAFGAALIVPAFGCYSNSTGKVCAGQSATNTMQVNGTGAASVSMTKGHNPAMSVNVPISPATSPYTIPGLRKVFDMQAYSDTGNLVTNPKFASGITGWTMHNLTDDSGNPLYSTVTHDGNTWLRLDQSVSAPLGNPDRNFYQTITIPSGLQNVPLQISFLVEGFFTGFGVSDGTQVKIMRAYIQPGKPQKVNIYYNPNGASTVTITFYREFSNNVIAGQYFDVTNVYIAKASWTYQSISKGLSIAGSNVQPGWWTAHGWDEAKQDQILSNIRRLGGTARVWLSAEMFGAYTIKNNPTKRTLGPNNAVYTAETQAKIFTGLDPVKVKYLDWFFEAARRHGLKIIPCILAGYHDGTGTLGNDTSTTGAIEFLDTDTDVKAGVNALLTAVVTRYKSYENVVAWELLNEGWGTWIGNYAGFDVSATYFNRAMTWSAYRDWERTAYSAIKAVDPNRPIMLNTPADRSQGLYLFENTDVCDWQGHSLYIGDLYTDTISGGKFVMKSGTTGSMPNGTRLRAYTNGSFPAGIAAMTDYYVVNKTATSFQVSATLNGSPISIADGSCAFYFYSMDGQSIHAYDYIFSQIGNAPRPVIIPEIGAPNFISESGNRLYRIDSINSKYIQAVMSKLEKYGIASGLAWDEMHINPTLLWDSSNNFNLAGSVLAAVGAFGAFNTSSILPTVLDQSISTNATPAFAGLFLGTTPATPRSTLDLRDDAPIITAESNNGTSGVRINVNNASAHLVRFQNQGSTVFEVMPTGRLLAGTITDDGVNFIQSASASLGAITGNDLYISTSTPLLHFRSTNNSSGIRYDLQGTATDHVHRFQFNEVTQVEIFPTGNFRIGGGNDDGAHKLQVGGTAAIESGGSANKAVCWKADGKTLGYCSTQPDTTGACTCN